MRPGTRSFYEVAVQRAIERVVCQLGDAIDLATLAESACLSPFHFHRVFRGMVGETPMEFVRRLRLERAAWQLANTDHPVTRVAFDAGYETHEAFTRAFGVAYSTPPDPRGPGDKDTDFQRVSAAGVDSMKVSLRAATHLDFTEFAPTPPSSRYGAIVASYYTLAWFERYLKNSRQAEARLTATKFDGSADAHYISGGTYDAATGRNVPYRIAGQPVANRLSFHFRSAWFLDGGRARCEDIRAGCAPVTPSVRPVCTKPNFTPATARVRNGRVQVRPHVRCGGRKRDVVVRLRLPKRSVYVETGRKVDLRVSSSLRRIDASFSVDGRSHDGRIEIR